MEIPSGALLVTTTSDGHRAPMAASPDSSKLLISFPCGTKDQGNVSVYGDLAHSIWV